MRAHGAYTCLVSGGFTHFTTKIAAKIGFDESSANQLLVDDAGKLTGQVAEPIFGREAKLATLRALRARLGLSRDETLVAGDGANDLDMIREAGLGVAFHAKPAVAAAAAARIDHGDLTALLFAQGYRREEFAGYVNRLRGKKRCDPRGCSSSAPNTSLPIFRKAASLEAEGVDPDADASDLRGMGFGPPHELGPDTLAAIRLRDDQQFDRKPVVEHVGIEPANDLGAFGVAQE